MNSAIVGELQDMHFGVDVAIQRIDDLDRALITAVAHEQTLTKTPPRVLELGAGQGGLTTHLIRAGAIVTAVDCSAYQDSYAALFESGTHGTFVQQPLETYVEDNDVATFNFVSCQRTLHYLPYDTAYRVLARLSVGTHCGLFLSVTGVESAIGIAHPRRSHPLISRHAQLPAAAQETFAISAPLCVYEQSELVTLLQATGWQIERVWTSVFGNHKVIARPFN